ncbi:MAG: hypothetical protein U1E60_19005 [Reyranellaceae bacterium]
MVTKIGKSFGTDTLSGSDFDDLLIAMGAKTTLIGGLGNDVMFGGSANDIFIGGKGSDYMNGGGGMDTVDYSASGAPVTVNLATGKGSGGDAQGDTLISIEKVIGSAYDDTFIGSKGNDSFTGGAGNDKFVMSAGDDTITDFTPVNYTLIDFNDRPQSSLAPVPSGYGGLNWSNVSTNGPQYSSYPNTGYANDGLGTAVAYNGSGNEGTITTAGADFSLKSAYMAAAWNDNLQVTVQGWDDGVLKVTQIFALGVNRTLVNFVGFDSIDKVTFVGTGGTQHAGFTGGSGSQVVWDDIRLAFDNAPGDRIDVPDGTDVAALVASAVTDGLGGSLVIHSQGTIHLVGVQPQDVKADWFV